MCIHLFYYVFMKKMKLCMLIKSKYYNVERVYHALDLIEILLLSIIYICDGYCTQRLILTTKWKKWGLHYRL